MELFSGQNVEQNHRRNVSDHQDQRQPAKQSSSLLFFFALGVFFRGFGHIVGAGLPKQSLGP